MGSSIESFERQGIEGLIDEKDPEKMLVGKELMQMAMDFFDEEELAAIIGIKKKNKVAEKLGIEYDAYRKRLQRKILKFRSIPKDAGYDID